uniref:Histone deacetylase interacting domain-containing protein n=1 Tax=Kalanchoe fedtschenkoi TaxID=63787 RepID=A0A7N0U8T1_KALFE
MKRLGDDSYARSQFRRPFVSSRTESYVQSQVGGGGEGTSQKLTTNDALTYLKQVKDMFQDQREKYDQFLEVMKDFKAQRTDTTGVIQRVKELFKGHNHLILGFNTFLPKGYEITLDEKKTVEFEEAIGFVNKIKKRFQHDEHVYKSFLDILNMYRKEHKGITEVYQEVAALFDDHPDLLDEFTRFLPDNSAAPSIHQAPYNRSSFQHFDERSSGMPTLKRFPVEKQHRRDRMLGSHTERDLSVDRPDLEADKAMMKMHKEQRKRAEKEARDRRHRDHDDRELEHDRKPSRKIEGFGSPSFANEDDKSAMRSLYNWEFSFCEKVKERVTDPDEYQSFLKCLNIYSTEIVSRTELQNLMADVLGKYPDLADGFNEFLERCENIDSKTVKVEEREKAPKREIGTTKETDRFNEKYLAKSIQELDLSDCQRCTPSYRLLPEDYPIQRASQRSELGAQVLNDHWVSVTSGSEDYSFKHMRRNQYEESLFRCEDDRFELDMLLESVTSASRRVEELLNKLSDITSNIVTPLRLEEHFSALNIRCIERLYGDHGLDTVDILRKNPGTALPVILTRLKQKQEEWAKCRSDFNKVWADIYSKNHYKSLDHRSFYFKQQDSKNLSTKSLVTEIKEIKEAKQKEHDVLLTIAAGQKRPIIPNLEFEYPDPEIHENLYKLVHYSCEEICSTKEQLSKVMRLWTSFLEPMLGIPTRIDDGECIEAISTNGHQVVNVKACLGRTEKASGSPTDDVTIRNTWTPTLSSIGNESMLPESRIAHGETSSKENRKGGLDSINKDGIYLSTMHSGDELKNSAVMMSGCGVQVASDQQSTNSASHFPIAIETSPSKMCIDVDPASFRHINAGSENGANRKPNSGGSQLEDGSVEKYDKLENGAPTDGIKSNGYHGAAGGPSKVEKEEGELSPIGDSEEDVPLSPVEHHDVRSPRYEVGEAIGSRDAVEEIDADADDEDSENASMAGEVSGSESAGEDCSHEEHDEEDEAEHDEIDGKVESEGEAEGLDDANFAGGDGAMSERFLLNVKPLAKYVPVEWRDKAKKDSRVFYGNDNYYVLLRLHQMLYERILFAKTNTLAAEMKRRSLNDNGNLEPFTRFLKALYSLLDGSADNAKFEDDCRSLIGNNSYVLFTLDKLIYKLVKQLQSVASDEMDIKLLQLYDYEKSRKCENHVDSVYHENARILLHEDNIYRFEFASSLPRLSIQLMDSCGEKPEVAAVSIEPNFASYLYNDFLVAAPSKREPSGVLLQRNKRPLYARLDELSAMTESMDSVKMVNGLEYKIVCNSSKISYVLDTEDYFFRSKRKRKSVPAEKALRINQSRQERLHRLLHVFTNNSNISHS